MHFVTQSLLNSDAEVQEFYALRRNSLAAVSPDQMFLYGMPTNECGWRLAITATPRGNAAVLFRYPEVLVRIYGEGGTCAGSEMYSLDPATGDRYYQLSGGGPRGLKASEVNEHDLDDTRGAVVVKGATGPTRVAELDQFYSKDGFLRVECSHDLPAEVLARLLLVGYKAVAGDIEDVMEPGNRGRATAA